MAVKKKRTAKQIAATKKLVAFNKKRRKNPTPAKRRSRVKKKGVSRKSQATKKAPTARLKRRRAKPKVKGYYPNPKHSNYYVVKVTAAGKMSKGKSYFDGAGWTTKADAAIWHSQGSAKSIAQKIARSTGLNVAVLIDSK